MALVSTRFRPFPHPHLHPPQTLKGLLVFTWVWYLYLHCLTHCSSPDTTRFHSISINDSTLCVCSRASLSLRIDRAASLPTAICVVVFPLHWLLAMLSFLSHPLPLLIVCVCVCVRMHDTHLHLMHFSGSAVNVSIHISTTPGNNNAKIRAHSISIKCVDATSLCHWTRHLTPQLKAITIFFHIVKARIMSWMSWRSWLFSPFLTRHSR